MARKIIDLTGKKFHMLKVVSYAYTKDHKVYWNCLCDCGIEKIIPGGTMKKGTTKSCGCFIRSIVTKHGMKGTTTYHTWVGMIERCNKPNSTGYKNYGARGISICEKWINFKGFYEDMGVRPEGRTLDRKDNNGNYCKDNCKWSTKKEQDNNTRVNHYITYEGRTQTLTQWAEELGINTSTLKSRLGKACHYSIERAFTTKKWQRA